MSDAPSPSLCPDTSSGSLLHRLAHRRGPGSKPPRLVRVYLMVVAVTYLPLLLAAKLGSVPLWDGSGTGPLTFLHDWGIAWALLVSLPTLVVLLVSDEHVLSTSLDEVQGDGVIALSESAAGSLTATWTRYFRIWNLIAQFAGIAFGIVLGKLTLRSYVNDPVAASWIAPDGRPHLAGYVYLCCIILLYAMVIVYVTRCIVLSLFLRALVAGAPLRILPLHPDKCGGLRPVGRLGLRNQYTLTVLGINIVLLLVVWVYLMHDTASLRDVMIAASVAYLILGPVIFTAPLLPFRAGMQSAKKEWAHEVARVVRVEIERLRVQIEKNEVTNLDEEPIERLRKMGAAIEELPIWPFDPSTLRKFATAYIVPVALPLLVETARALFKAIGI
jgi:hypothetical protein